MGSKLPSWRDCATGNAPEQGGRKGLAALEKLLGELGRGQPQRLQAGDSPAGWLLTASDGSEEAVMVHLVAREDLMWYKPQTGEEEGTLQVKIDAPPAPRLMLPAIAKYHPLLGTAFLNRWLPPSFSCSCLEELLPSSDSSWPPAPPLPVASPS